MSSPAVLLQMLPLTEDTQQLSEIKQDLSSTVLTKGQKGHLIKLDEVLKVTGWWAPAFLPDSLHSILSPWNGKLSKFKHKVSGYFAGCFHREYDHGCLFQPKDMWSSLQIGKLLDIKYATTLSPEFLLLRANLTHALCTFPGRVFIPPTMWQWFTSAFHMSKPVLERAHVIFRVPYAPSHSKHCHPLWTGPFLPPPLYPLSKIINISQVLLTIHEPIITNALPLKKKR